MIERVCPKCGSTDNRQVGGSTVADREMLAAWTARVCNDCGWDWVQVEEIVNAGLDAE